MQITLRLIIKFSSYSYVKKKVLYIFSYKIFSYFLCFMKISSTFKLNKYIKKKKCTNRFSISLNHY